MRIAVLHVVGVWQSGAFYRSLIEQSCAPWGFVNLWQGQLCCMAVQQLCCWMRSSSAWAARDLGCLSVLEAETAMSQETPACLL